jgi:hypothetical protein
MREAVEEAVVGLTCGGWGAAAYVMIVSRWLGWLSTGGGAKTWGWAVGDREMG